MIKKGASVGPGLAYSEARTVFIVNMRKFDSRVISGLKFQAQFVDTDADTVG